MAEDIVLQFVVYSGGLPGETALRLPTWRINVLDEEHLPDFLKDGILPVTLHCSTWETTSRACHLQLQRCHSPTDGGHMPLYILSATNITMATEQIARLWDSYVPTYIWSLPNQGRRLLDFIGLVDILPLQATYAILLYSFHFHCSP